MPESVSTVDAILDGLDGVMVRVLPVPDDQEETT